MEPRRGPHRVYRVVRPRFGPPKGAGAERKQFMQQLNRKREFQRAEVCARGPSSSPAAKKAKRERSAPRSPGGQLVAAVGSTASRARAAVNDAISSVVARAKKSWGPGVLEQMQKQNTRRACSSAVKSLSRAHVHFL